MGTRWTFRPHPSSSADPGWMALYTSSTTTHKRTLMVLCSLELEDPNCPAKRNNGFFHPFPTYIYRPCCDSGRCMLYTLIMDMLKFIVDINLSRNSFLFSILLAQKIIQIDWCVCFVLFCFSLARRSSRWARLVTNSRHQFIYQNFFVFFFSFERKPLYTT